MALQMTQWLLLKQQLLKQQLGLASNVSTIPITGLVGGFASA
jgi:3-hydroxyacyl-CoA dehydrogenase